MIIPQSNLPIGSKPWADAVSLESGGHDKDIESTASRQRAFIKEQNASVQLLSQQISDLSTQINLLPIMDSVSIDTLGPGFTGTGGWNTLWTLTKPFPDGKSIANVLAFGMIRGGHPGVAGVSIFFRVGVNGSYGPDTPASSDWLGNVAQAAVVPSSSGSVTITGQGMATGGSIVDTRVSLYGLIAFE